MVYGITPELVAGTWVGGDERYIHFNTMAYGQGAAMALPIYGLFMKKVYGDKSLPYSQSTKFEFPADIDLCEKEYFGEEDLSDATTMQQKLLLRAYLTNRTSAALPDHNTIIEFHDTLSLHTPSIETLCHYDYGRSRYRTNSLGIPCHRAAH